MWFIFVCPYVSLRLQLPSPCTDQTTGWVIAQSTSSSVESQEIFLFSEWFTPALVIPTFLYNFNRRPFPWNWRGLSLHLNLHFHLAPTLRCLRRCCISFTYLHSSTLSLAQEHIQVTSTYASFLKQLKRFRHVKFGHAVKLSHYGPRQAISVPGV